MDRVVNKLYGKLYMGHKLVPHYYVQFKHSKDPEYVAILSPQRTVHI